MNRRQHDDIARIIAARTLAAAPNGINKSQLVDTLIAFFEADDPDFNRQRFEQKCYPPKGERPNE